MQSVFDIFVDGLNRLSGKWGKLVLLYVVIVLFYILCLLPILMSIDFNDFMDAAQKDMAKTKYWYLTLYEYLLGIFVLVPVLWAFTIMYLRNIRGEENTFKVSQLFDGFKDYARITFTQLLVLICTFLWSILLIVPGIMKFYSYAMTPYVLYDNPKVGYLSAMDISCKMMYGYRFKLFGLHCLYLLMLIAFSILNSFISPLLIMTVYAGPLIFCLVMIGYVVFIVGFLIWSTSAYNSSVANFYEQLKKEYETTQIIDEPNKE